jgi:hypothetical protein
VKCVFAALGLIASLAFAGAAAADPGTTTNCSRVAACAFFINSGSGPGLFGKSAHAAGVLGISSDANGSDFRGAVTGIALGLGGTTGVYGQGAAIGVLGKGDLGLIGVGLRAGVYGLSKLPATAQPFNTGYGVVGFGRGGVEGFGAALPGLLGLNFTGGTPNAYGMLAFGPLSAGTLSEGAIGLIALATPTGAGTGLIPSALQLEASTGVATLMRGIGATGHSVVSLDATGNLILAGTLTQTGSPNLTTRGTDGSTTVAFGMRTTQPAIEDTGEAQLQNGTAYVALERAFAATIDRNHPYLAFVVPEGDTHGLYVATRTQNGFTIRENDGGHSNVAFAYRIVAKPYDAASERLPAASERAHLEAGLFPSHAVTFRREQPPALH